MARTKRAVSQQKVPSDVVDDSVVAKAALSRNKKDLQQQQSEPDLPSPECMEKMERIMVKANGLNERGLVKFLRLLHSLRVEQEPERAAVITEAAIDSVENDGEYSCNLSALGPEAIDKLWALMKEIRV
ncbi:hypothetical protein GGI12_000379 [Dipsacomyces acuminosporus]|nr:hypothetical protein GGI12_000379 [Dipsacomyces acuminosporus]